MLLGDTGVPHNPERKPAEPDYLAAIAEAVFTGLIATDRDFRVLWCNRSATEFFPEVAIGETLHDLMGQIAHEQKVDQLLLHREMITITFDSDRPAINWLNCEQRLPDGGHLIMCWPETYSEVLSDRRASFTMAAFHELKTPLTALKGFAEMLDLDRDSLTPEQRESVTMILEITGQMESLTRDIHDLAMNSFGELTLDLGPVDLEQVVRSVIGLHRSDTAGECRLQDPGIEPDLPPVEADEFRIRQVINNLVGNACLHNPDGTVVEVHLRRDGDGIEVEVRDHGDGLGFEPPELAFNSFYRPESSTSKGTPGSGIGLPLAKRLVELHRGRITLENCSDGGTRAVVWLPLDRDRSLQPAGPGRA